MRCRQRHVHLQVFYSRTTGRENKGGEKRMAYDSLWFTFADIV